MFLFSFVCTYNHPDSFICFGDNVAIVAKALQCIFGHPYFLFHYNIFCVLKYMTLLDFPGLSYATLTVIVYSYESRVIIISIR
jgi:hypothetical protein